MTTSRTIRIVAALIRDEAGRVITGFASGGTSAFMQPGWQA